MILNRWTRYLAIAVVVAILNITVIATVSIVNYFNADDVETVYDEVTSKYNEAIETVDKRDTEEFITWREQQSLDHVVHCLDCNVTVDY